MPKFDNRTKHGHARDGKRSRAYNTWLRMIDRCCNPHNDRFDDYGGRGITVCEQWRDFRNFFADMGERPDGLTLDRIDNDQGYSPDNCRWATRRLLWMNRRKPRRTISFDIVKAKLFLTTALGTVKSQRYCAFRSYETSEVAFLIVAGISASKLYHPPSPPHLNLSQRIHQTDITDGNEPYNTGRIFAHPITWLTRGTSLSDNRDQNSRHAKPKDTPINVKDPRQSHPLTDYPKAYTSH